MERWERPPHRRSRSKNPSFSSSLLDAIYRSIDEEHADKNSHLGAPDRSSNHKKREGQPMPAPCIDRCHCRSRTTPPGSERAANRPSLTDYRRHGSIARGSVTLTSCSSSSSSSTTTTAAVSRTSSSTGFSSSSDAESIRSDCIPRPHHPTPEKKTKKSKCGSIRSGLRGLRKSRTPDAASMAAPSPASPGARLASFLNALFASAGNPKKPKTSTHAVATTAAAGCGGSEDSACSSSASSCRRSCLSKAPAMADRRRGSGAEAGKRSVRFYPVSVIVDEDSRPCGHKRLQDDTEGAAAPVAARVEELLTAAGADVEAEEEEEVGGSESSSDLFELENLTVVMRGGGYRDELPVYETTDLSTNRAIAQGLIH
ncbi:hypothetical protein MUK42_00763 [Musa troglodytarum]|uniref:Protein BIG GRAIN 1-like n=1 Tax=Musa troglodytarum TaxID=320322 RepID=A0A9E7JUP3_9LILI|nr:hypothetical protein MUK42_00763 [Musa troglodytarum]